MELILGIALFIVGIIQIIMIIRFFEMASDIKDMRNMMAGFLNGKTADQEKANNDSTSIDNKPMESASPKEDKEPTKFTWKSWVAIAVIIIVLILAFLK